MAGRGPWASKASFESPSLFAEADYTWTSETPSEK